MLVNQAKPHNSLKNRYIHIWAVDHGDEPATKPVESVTKRTEELPFNRLEAIESLFQLPQLNQLLQIIKITKLTYSKTSFHVPAISAAR